MSGSWLPELADGETPLDRVFGLHPQLYELWRAFVDVFWERRLLDPVTLELCRLRCAQLLRCEAEMAARTPQALAAGLGEEHVAALPQWATDPRFTAEQRACLAVTEQFVLDPHAVTEDQRAAVVAHVGEGGLVALTEALAIFDGFCRFRTILGITGTA